MSSSPAHIELQAQCLTAASQIATECALLLSNDPPTTTPNLSGCDTPLIQLLHRQATLLHTLLTTQLDSPSPPPLFSPPPLVLRRLNDLIDASYAKFYAFPFKDLPACWRQLYTDASILKFALLYLSWAGSSTTPTPGRGEEGKETEAQLGELIRPLDLALILAGAEGRKRGRRWIDRAFGLLEEVWAAPAPAAWEGGLGGRAAKRRRVETRVWGDSFPTVECFTPPVRNSVQRVDGLSFEDFQTYLDGAGQMPRPLVLTGLMGGWPAMGERPWKSPGYLLSRTFGGRRLVPVEVGRSYVDEGWGQRVVGFGEFLERWVVGGGRKGEGKGYLAQYPLLSHIPTLLLDIHPPDLL
ncbi:hypothetical protein C8A05DRAFT_16634, partial [Staphylotrichum tortipilum]